MHANNDGNDSGNTYYAHTSTWLLLELATDNLCKEFLHEVINHKYVGYMIIGHMNAVMS